MEPKLIKNPGPPRADPSQEAAASEQPPSPSAAVDDPYVHYETGSEGEGPSVGGNPFAGIFAAARPAATTFSAEAPAFQHQHANGTLTTSVGPCGRRLWSLVRDTVPNGLAPLPAPLLLRVRCPSHSRKTPPIHPGRPRTATNRRHARFAMPLVPPRLRQ